MARSSTGSEVVIMDEKTLASHAVKEMPSIASVHVTKSSKVHIGPKIVAVNQTITNKEVVTDLPLPKYIWSVVKNTSRTERLACAAALVVLAVCIALIIYFNLKTTTEEPVDVAPHEWRISREMWLADEHDSNHTTEDYNPLKLVIVQHTVSSECHTFIQCAAEVRNLQSYFLKIYKYDIPYTFLIGNDGRVYEGRGWNTEGAHTRGYNLCSVGLAFIGDYREELQVYTKVSDLQLKRARMILQEGVDLGYLVPDFHVVGAKDLQATASPGSNLYNALKKWEHYDLQNQYANKNCSQIYAVN